jgi:hypothetical protein
MIKFVNETRARWLLISIVISLISISCKNNSRESNIIIEKSKDTLNPHEEITVKIHLKNNRSSRLRSVHILEDMDDFQVPIDTIEKCGVFKAEGSKRGERNWNGYVLFYDSLSNCKKEEFKFSYFIK